MSSEHDTETQNASAPQSEQEPVLEQAENAAPEAPSDETEAEATEEANGDAPALFGEMTLPTAEAAQWLRALADAVEAGQLPGETATLAMPERLSYKLELEQELEESITSLEYEIEVEIEWNAEA
jgi:amphi-Trp domain-containing protein